MATKLYPPGLPSWTRNWLELRNLQNWKKLPSKSRLKSEDICKGRDGKKLIWEWANCNHFSGTALVYTVSIMIIE